MINAVAFIPDGNRRYAQKRGFSLRHAYLAGFNKAREVVEWAFEDGIKQVTVWTISTENLKRSGIELRVFLLLLKKELNRLLTDEMIHSKGVRVNIIGRLDLLPKEMRALAKKVMQKTAHYTGYTLNLAIGYGGRAELVDAVKLLLAKKMPVSEASLAQCLYTSEEPDLVIRTGDTQRMSGFMPWQSAYSELVFSKKLWPEFSKRDFENALKEYGHRDRRFGR